MGQQSRIPALQCRWVDPSLGTKSHVPQSNYACAPARAWLQWLARSLHATTTESCELQWKILHEAPKTQCSQINMFFFFFFFNERRDININASGFKIVIKKIYYGASLVSEIPPAECRKHRFNPWPRRFHMPLSNRVPAHSYLVCALEPRAACRHMPQLLKPERPRDMLLNKRSHHNESPPQLERRPFSATREKACAAKTRQHQNK